MRLVTISASMRADAGSTVHLTHIPCNGTPLVGRPVRDMRLTGKTTARVAYMVLWRTADRPQPTAHSRPPTSRDALVLHLS